MSTKSKIRVRMNEGRVELLVLISHPMETGLRRDKKTGRLIPAHFITNISVKLNGQLVAAAELGRSISRNPLLGFRLKKADSGDTIRVTWADNRGASDVLETSINL